MVGSSLEPIATVCYNVPIDSTGLFMSRETAVLQTASETSTDQRPVAPFWHLVCTFVLLAAWVLLSLQHPHRAAGKPSPRIAGYLSVLIAEWVLFFFIWLGLRIQRVPFANLFGEISARFRKFILDVGIAVLFLIVANIVLALMGGLLRVAKHNAGVQQLLPKTPSEIAVYLLVCITAGICEETIFRGYLQRQFTAYTKSAVLGALIQGILFGLAHAYQGWKMIVIIAVYGCLFGALVLWRKSLRPGIIAHFLQDSIAGIFLARHL